MSVILQASNYLGAFKSIVKSNKFKFNNVEINNVLSYTYDEKKSLTSVPLESGASINDHSYLEPVVATVEISESKFKNILDEIKNTINNFATLGADIISGDVFDLDGSFYETSSATAKLDKITETLQDLEVYFDVELPVRKIDNMTLVGITVSGNPSTQGGFIASLFFRQLQFIDTDTGISALGTVARGLKKKTDFTGSIL